MKLSAEQLIAGLTHEEALELEYLLCKRDFFYWFANFGCIKDDRVGQIYGPGLTCWEGQRQYLQALLDLTSVITGKSRQVGVSWLASHVEVWDAMFHENIAESIVAQNDDWSMIHLARNRWIYEQQPPHLRRVVPVRGSDNMHELGFSNGSYIDSRPSTKGGSRGGSRKRIRCEELAFWQNPDQAMLGILGSIADGGQLIINSTANGEGGLYWDYWQKAVEGRIPFKPVFFSWRVHPGRDDAWYAAEVAKLGALVKQEYPDTAEEMFVSTGTKFFDAEQLIALAAEHQGRPCEYKLEGGVEWSIYEVAQQGHEYVIGADVADGGGDGSSADVIDVATGRQVAHVHSFTLPSEEFGDVLYMLGMLYGFALLGVERNNMGHATVAVLKRKRYPRLYHHQFWDEAMKKARPRAGWLTDKTSRAIMLSDLRAAVSAGALTMTHEASYKEARIFGWYAGRWDHPPGGHDDAVISLAIAQQMRLTWLRDRQADGGVQVYQGEERIA